MPKPRALIELMKKINLKNFIDVKWLIKWEMLKT